MFAGLNARRLVYGDLARDLRNRDAAAGTARQRPVETAHLHRLVDVLRADQPAFLEIGNGARDLQSAIVGAGRERVAIDPRRQLRPRIGRRATYVRDVAYARKLGVRIEDLLISQPDTGEQALEIAETLVRSGAVDLVVIDSVAALVPKAEIEGEMGDAHMGLQARLMSQALRKLTAVVSRNSATVIFINQIRM